MKRFAGHRVMVVKEPAARRPAAVATTARGGRVNGSTKQFCVRRPVRSWVERSFSTNCKPPQMQKQQFQQLRYTYRFYCRSCTFCKSPHGCRGWGGRASYDGNIRTMTVRAKLLSCHGDFDAQARGQGQAALVISEKKLVVDLVSQGGSVTVQLLSDQMAEKLSENVSLPDESAVAHYTWRISASERFLARKGLSCGPGALGLSDSV